MKTLTLADLRALAPCYDPVKYLPEGWQGTAHDVLNVDACPAADRIWVVTRPGLLSDKVLRLFAVWCAREALRLVPNPDHRSIAACDVAERYAHGQATQEELSAAWDAVACAAWATSRAVAGAAAGAAARKVQVEELKRLVKEGAE